MADPWGEFADAPTAPRTKPADPWAEFDDAAAIVPNVANVRRSAPRLPSSVRPTGAVYDGDTFGLTSGGNARLSGVDAFELGQTGRRHDGSVMPLGTDARDFLNGRVSPNSSIMDTGNRTYGRPVVMLRTGGQDAGQGSIGAGLSVPTPHYLQSDPQRLDAYVRTQRDAIAAERGAYAGQYQLPSDYRREGAAAPMRGKIPMTPQQRKEYLALLRDPKTTEADLSAWIQAQGHAATNVGNILTFMRRNPNAKAATYFQQQDVQGAPVLPDGPGIVTRALAALNEGIADTLGAPVDIVNAGLGAIGLPVSDRPFLGSEMIRGGINDLGIGQVDEGYAPQSNAEAYLQSGARGLGQAAIPAGGLLGGGGRLALRGTSALTAASPIRSAGRTLLTEAARRPGVTLAGEAGAGVGAGVGGQAARDTFPNSPWADVAGQFVGGAVGGIGAGVGASRVRRAPLNAPARTADRLDVWAEFADAPEIGAAPEGRGRFVGPRSTEGESVEGERPFNLPASSNGGESTGLPKRTVDRIDIWSEFADAPSGALDDPQLGRVRPMGQQATPGEMAAVARGMNPEDVTPIPSNEIASLDEAMRANPGSIRDVTAPNERDALPPYRLAPNAPVRRDPIDLVGWLRTKGGIREEAGELASMGIDNKARPIEFAKSEGFLGKLVSDEGMSLDDAAGAAWEAGFFPDHVERPTVAEFLDALRTTHSGGSGRVFHPDDYATLDAFNSARAQRGAVEMAAQEGSPLAEDVGQPIGLDDLDAIQPPVTAYEDLPSVGGKAGNIRLDGLDSKEDIRRALVATEQRVGGFDAARRGRISQGETEALARELGMTADDLLKRRKGQALNAEQALAARSILAKSSDELIGMARKAKGGSEEDLAAFRRAWLRHVAIQEQVSGATAEAGRALAQFKMAASSRIPRGRVLREMVDDAGGRDKLEQAADAILELQDQGAAPGAVNSFALNALKPKFSDKLVELWYNSLLSGPQTHAVNILSNSMTAALQLPEHAAAAAIGGARRLVSRGSVDRVVGSEIGARAVGLLQGAREGLRAFARTARTGQVLDPMTKVEAVQHEAISGVKGKIIRTPTRMLSAEDELFKAIGRRMELSGLAVRKAATEGLKGEAFERRVADLTANPTDDMLERALDYARYVTFQRPLGPVGQAVSRMTQDMPALKLILPFVRTPSNIFKYVLERSPLAPVMREWRADFKVGGARRDLALARMALGTGLGMLVTQLAEQGLITGSGPADGSARELLLADGWQPYSLRIGDRYYSYQRLDPLASTLGVGADLAARSDGMSEEERNSAASHMVASILKNLSNKTWLSGLADAIQALEDPDRYSSRWLGRTAGSLAVPAGVAQVARTVDPVLRETKTPLDAVRARVPGLSQRLLPRRDIWGEEIGSEGGLGPDIMSPIWTRTRRNDPLNAEMLRIGAGIGKPSKRVGKVTLSPEDYNAYQAEAGRATRRGLLGVIGDPSWRPLTPEEQLAEVQRIKDEARRWSRERLFGAAR